MQIFDWQLSKEIGNKQNTNKRKINFQRMSKIKELANLYISVMTGLRNPSTQEETS